MNQMEKNQKLQNQTILLIHTQAFTNTDAHVHKHTQIYTLAHIIFVNRRDFPWISIIFKQYNLYYCIVHFIILFFVLKKLYGPFVSLLIKMGNAVISHIHLVIPMSLYRFVIFPDMS